jgi:RHS repeat-associated protein
VKESLGQERLWFASYELDHQNTPASTDDLYFLHARWYFPSMARFLSPDPLRGNPARPQSLNLYAYVANNPVNLVDPWGLKDQGAMSPSSTSDESQRDGVCSGVLSDPDCAFHEEITVTGKAPGIDLQAIADAHDAKVLQEWLAWQAYTNSAYALRAARRISARGFEDPMLQVLASVTGVLLPSERPLVEGFDAAYENWFANPQLGLGEDTRYGRLWGPLGNAVWLATRGECGSSCVGWATGLYSALAPLASDRARPVLVERGLFGLPLHTFVAVEVRRGAGWVTVRRYDPFWRLR